MGKGRFWFFSGCSILLFSLLLSWGTAQAYVYDDFTNEGIDSTKWTDRGPNSGLFSQAGDGYLYFNDSSGEQTDILRSIDRVSGPFFVSMHYDAFTADTTSTNGSAPVLWIGDSTETSTKRVRVYEFKSKDRQGFWARFADGTTISPLGSFVPSTVTSGWLGIGYDGSIASLWYDEGSGWESFATVAPGFTNNPYFFIEGYNPDGTSLSFKVGEVRLDPVPLPPAIVFLGTGLLGLGAVGWRRRRKN